MIQGSPTVQGLDFQELHLHDKNVVIWLILFTGLNNKQGSKSISVVERMEYFIMRIKIFGVLVLTLEPPVSQSACSLGPSRCPPTPGKWSSR